MAESLFWFPGYNLGYINQVAQKNVRCLLTRIMSVAGMCLCMRNTLITGKPHWTWATTALTDPLSTTLFGLSTGSKSFPPSGFPSHLLNLHSHLVLTFMSALLFENRNSSSLCLVFSKMYGVISWFTVIHCCCFPFFPSSAWVYVLDTTWQRERWGKEERLGCGSEAGAEGTLCDKWTVSVPGSCPSALLHLLGKKGGKKP